MIQIVLQLIENTVWLNHSTFKFQLDLGHDHLYYREDRKRWLLDYWLPPNNQKRMTITLPKHYSKSKATKARDDKYAQLKEGRLTEKEVYVLPGDLTIDGAIECYKNLTFINKSEKSKEHDNAILRLVFKFFKEELGYQDFQQIKTADILKFRQHLEDQVKIRKEAEKIFKEKATRVQNHGEKLSAEKLRTVGIAPATARGLLRDLRKVFNGLFLHGKIHVNPYKKIPPLAFAQSDLVRSVTPKASDLERMLKCSYHARSNVDFPIKEFVEFLSETGARDDEAIHLEWSDIENGVWHLGNKPNCPTRFGIGWTSKWGKKRKIVLSPRALEVLSRIPRYPNVLGYVTTSNEERLKAKAEGTKPKVVGYPAHFVFTVKDGNTSSSGGRRRVDDYGKTWDSLLKSAGLPYFGPNKLHAHDFRRFKNKQDEYRGKTVQERSENLGHAEAVNQSNYFGEDDEQILAAKAKINRLRFEIGQCFKAGEKDRVNELMSQEMGLRLELARLLGNEAAVLFQAI